MQNGCAVSSMQLLGKACYCGCSGKPALAVACAFKISHYGETIGYSEAHHAVYSHQGQLAGASVICECKQQHPTPSLQELESVNAAVESHES